MCMCGRKCVFAVYHDVHAVYAYFVNLTCFVSVRLGVKARAICVEAEPSHVDYLRDAFWEMGNCCRGTESVLASEGARGQRGLVAE